MGASGNAHLCVFSKGWDHTLNLESQGIITVALGPAPPEPIHFKRKRMFCGSGVQDLHMNVPISVNPDRCVAQHAVCVPGAALRKAVELAQTA